MAADELVSELQRMVDNLTGDCDHPLEDYEEYGFHDGCPECEKLMDASLHSIALHIQELVNEHG